MIREKVNSERKVLMSTPRSLMGLFCVAAITIGLTSAQVIGHLGSYKVTYGGGNLKPDAHLKVDLKVGDKLTLEIGSDSPPLVFYQTGKAPMPIDVRGNIFLDKGKNLADEFSSSSVTEISYGQNVISRVGADIGVVVSPGKSGTHYIGLTWNELGAKHGAVFQVNEKDYYPLLSGLERFTGKKAVDTEK